MEIRDHLLKLPEALSPRFPTPRPNESIILSSGVFSVYTGGHELIGRATLRWVWTPSPRLLVQFSPIEGSGESETIKKLDAAFVNSDPVLVRLDNTVDPVPATLVSVNLPVDAVMLVHQAERGAGVDLQWVDFHLVNFPHYIGRAVRVGEPEGKIKGYAGRLILSHQGWRITIDSAENEKDLREGLKATGGWVVTNAGRIERPDGQTFSSADAQEQLDCLAYFLSFVRGAWCSPVLYSGYNRDAENVWERFHTPQIYEYRYRMSWFPSHQPAMIESAWQGFLDKWSDPSWRETLRVAISLYLESNQSPAIETSLISLQIGLEMLSLKVLIDADPGNAEKYEGMPAARRLKKLLTSKGLDESVPANLSRLEKARSDGRWADGPNAITRIRNWIVHPTPANRNAIATVDFATRREAKELGLWYFELVLLWLTGYDGPYVNRLAAQWVGETESVPWSGAEKGT